MTMSPLGNATLQTPNSSSSSKTSQPPYHICICTYDSSQDQLLLQPFLFAAPLPTHARLFAESVTTRSACRQSLPIRHAFGLSAQQKGDRQFKGVIQDQETTTALVRLQRIDRSL
ncbi:hypothetical protein PG984_002234 [Apiospora sp. TS-2023a]